MSLNLDFVISSTKAKALSRHQNQFVGIATDTRKPMPEALFVALKGDSFDAHSFAWQAVQTGGARGVLIHDEKIATDELLKRATVLLVPDTLNALQDLARAVRIQNKAKVIGIAGSNGKTTSKEFTAALIGQFRKTHYSKGSFNNHWGVPFTLLEQPLDSEVAVVEMGMNHTGELAVLTKIAQPDVAVCTYVGIEHIEYFGTLEKIAEAESEIYQEAPADALRIFNLDNLYTLHMYKNSLSLGQRTMTFSSENQAADVFLKVKRSDVDQMFIEGRIAEMQGQVEVPVFGRHNITNLMVAAASALAVGLKPSEIWQGLTACRTTWGRNQWVEASSGAKVLFDAYNANPDSMKAMADNIASLNKNGKRTGVFAEMRELGEQAPEWHRSTAEYLVKAGWDQIWFFGPHFQEFGQGLKNAGYRGLVILTESFEEKAAKDILLGLGRNDVLILKGSRGMKLEKVAQMAGANVGTY
jgi:UDP-N-acetylmuramoyl-tripeptide--D-alanyl-D-alanine ligase